MLPEKNRFTDISRFPHGFPYISGPMEILNEEYHNGEKYSAFISSTGLKQYLKSPLWFKHAIDNKVGGIGKEAQVVGNAYHDLLASYTNTGSDEWFMENYVLFKEPINSNTGKPYGMHTDTYKKLELEQKELNPGKELITQFTFDNTQTMVNHLLYGSRENSKDIRMFLKYGKAERSYFCEYEGAYFKFRKDLGTRKKIIDWKTISADNLHENTIRKQITNYKYDISAAFYQFFDHIITGTWKEFYWVFQQKEAPYDFVIVDASPYTYAFANELINGKREKIITDVNIGARKFHALLEQHIHCVEEGYWPGAAIFIQEETFGPQKGKRIMKPEIPFYENKDIVFYN